MVNPCRWSQHNKKSPGLEVVKKWSGRYEVPQNHDKRQLLASKIEQATN